MKINLGVIKEYIKENLELFLVPIFFLFFLLLIKYTWGYFDLPNQEDLIQIVQNFFKIYGLPVIFISSILESMLFLGWYFPGSLVIFLGVASTTGNPILAAKTVIVVCLGMLVGYSVNYFLGKYGWYKVLMKYGFKDELIKIEKRLHEQGMFASFFFYVMPGFGSLLSTAFGVLKFNYIKFFLFTLLMLSFWNTIWGILVYHFGMDLFKLLTNSVSMFILFCVYFYYIYNKEKAKNEN